MIMDDNLPQDETTLHTPNVIPFYDITNCTFKEESITMGDDVIASQNNSDNDLEECTFKVGSTQAGTNQTKIEMVEERQTGHIDVKMEDIIVVDSNKPRPPALILSKNPSSLSSSFKKIVDETLSDETNTLPSHSLTPNMKTIVVKPLPKLTRILPMIPITTADRIVKFGHTPKILQINSSDTSKRVLLPKSKSVDEKSTLVKDKLKATILKTSGEGVAIQSNVKQSARTAANNDKKQLKTVAQKKDVVDKTEDKLKVSRNRAAAKRYR